MHLFHAYRGIFYTQKNPETCPSVSQVLIPTPRLYVPRKAEIHTDKASSVIEIASIVVGIPQGAGRPTPTPLTAVT